MELDRTQTAEGETVYIDRTDTERGSVGPFYVVYATTDRTDRWGFHCSACESFDNAMDTMGRIVCNQCENIRKAEEWDAAHE